MSFVINLKLNGKYGRQKQIEIGVTGTGMQ